MQTKLFSVKNLNIWTLEMKYFQKLMNTYFKKFLWFLQQNPELFNAVKSGKNSFPIITSQKNISSNHNVIFMFCHLCCVLLCKVSEIMCFSKWKLSGLIRYNFFNFPTYWECSQEASFVVYVQPSVCYNNALARWGHNFKWPKKRLTVMYRTN